MPFNSVVSRTDMGGMIPVEYATEIFKGLKETSAALRFGRRLRDMNRYQKTMPVLSALATAYFVTGDTGLKQTTEVNWEGVTITAEELAAIVPVPQAALDDNQFDIWGEVRPEIEEALGLAVDNAIFYGTNAPASWPTDLLAGCVAATNTVTLGTGVDLYEDLLAETGVYSLVENDGFAVTACAAHVGMKGRLRNTRSSTGEPIFKSNMQDPSRYEVDGAEVRFPINGSMDSSQLWLLAGQWNQLVYSIRQDLTWKVADEAVIQDASGNIVYNLFQQDMVALRVVMRLGWQLPNPINRINTSSSTRYPFAALIP